MIEVEHRREAEVDALCGKLRCDELPAALCRIDRAGSVAIPTLTECAHRRQFAKSVAESLDTAALVIDRDQQRRVTQGVNRVGEEIELPGRFIVAREQDNAAHER